MRAHVVSTVSQADLEILVAEDLFLLAKDGVRELGVEGRNILEARLRRRDEADIDGIVGVGQPWRGKLALNALVQGGCRKGAGDVLTLLCAGQSSHFCRFRRAIREKVLV